MNKKEVLELKRRFKKDKVTFTRLCGCYVDANREKVCSFSNRFLNLEDEEFHKYLEIANKCLSGKLDNNLLNLEFPIIEEEVGGRQQILMALRDSNLEDEGLIDSFYDHVIDSYEYAGNYLILLFNDAYDVMTKTKDNIDLDESEEVYRYILVAICPVTLSKAALGYKENENRIGARDRDWVVGAPDSALLFPAFNDRSTDIHSTLFYTKNVKEPHTEFVQNGLGCNAKRTATEQKIAFHSIVRNVLGPEEESTDGTLLNIQQTISDMIDDYDLLHENEEDRFILDSNAVEKALTECNVAEEKADRIIKSVEETFGDDVPVAEHVVDERALEKNMVNLEKIGLINQVDDLSQQLEEKDNQIKKQEDELQEKNIELTEKMVELSKTTEALDTYESEEKNYDVVLHVKPQKASQITSQNINGKKCIVIPMEDNENATINGVNTDL